MRALLALLAALALLLPGAAGAEERILYFLSDVTIEADGGMMVTETIRVRAEGGEIRRGIYRDFPTRYKNRRGQQMTVGFEVAEVSRNGAPEPWHTTSQGNGVRVYVGDADIFLPYGEHEYKIRYHTTRQLGYFQKYDELYWNVTGNGWIFPIDAAEARIQLPRPAPFGDRFVYTGPQGSTADNAAVISEVPGEILFRTTAPLAPYEGLTIAVAWPKGVVTAPGPSTKLGWWVQDNGPPATALFGLFAILAYYFYAWRRAGRGPQAGTVVPLFSPPGDMSAASVRYVSEMGADNRTFAAALIDLAVRGKLRLVEGEKGFFSRAKTTIEKAGSDATLPTPEAAMLARLFGSGDSLLMDNKNHATFSAAQTALKSGLKKQYEGDLFVRNWTWSMRGLLLMLAAIWLTAAALILASPVAHNSMKLLFVPLSGLAALGVAFLLYRRASKAGAETGVLAKIGAAIIGLVAIGIGMATIGAAVTSGRVLPLLVPMIALPVVISAFWWMAAPTKKGRAVLDQIAGFRRYLSITEEERLEQMHPPKKTPELFEKYLPYAIALKVENAWASRFTAVLAAAAATSQAQTMTWYSGHSDPWSDTDGFVDRMGSSLASTISSASTAPGSSSGSSGGGSSGGGGGGGGGGGW